MTLRSGLALGAAVLCAWSGAASGVIVLGNGQHVPLSDILTSQDRGFIVGDKLFTVVSFTTNTVPATAINVQGYIASNPLTGTGFDLTGGFGDTNNTDGQIADFNIRYTAEILPDYIAQGFRIVDTELLFDGSAVGDGSFARVSETVLDFFGQPGDNFVGNMMVFANAGPPPSADYQDRRVFGPPGYLKLEVNKDVLFFANGPGSTASGSFVRQSFSQVPSPTSAALLGLAGLVTVRRRR